jgi:hypothetical protein
MRIGSLVLLALLLFAPPRTLFEDSLAAAKTLYQSAAYEEALALLDRLRSAPEQVAATDLPAVGQYRAYCLLALGRQADADRAIEEIVLADPFFLPSENDVSPRVRDAFAAVRRRVLPTVVQQRYAKAKATFDRKDHAAAVEQFTAVSALLQDPNLGEAPGLADLKLLAAGFLDLARSAVAAAAPAPAPPAPAPPAPAALPPRVYNATDPGITLPVARRQDVPRWPNLSGSMPRPTRKGVLDILIDESGQVQGAMMRESVDPRYDELLLAAARGWRYTPATMDGHPVKFMKRIQVVVQ